MKKRFRFRPARDPSSITFVAPGPGNHQIRRTKPQFRTHSASHFSCFCTSYSSPFGASSVLKHQSSLFLVAIALALEFLLACHPTAYGRQTLRGLWEATATFFSSTILNAHREAWLLG